MLSLPAAAQEQEPPPVEEYSDYTGDDYFPVVRQVPDSVVGRLKNQKEFRYANDPSFWTEAPRNENPAFARFIESIARSGILKWVLYVFLAFIIGVVLYQLIVVNNLFVFKTRKRKNAEKSGLGEAAGPLSPHAFEDAARSGDYRTAVRYIYLRSLELLDGAGAITMNAKTTNQQYLAQMQKHSLRREFSWLTKVYEYVWYGEFSPAPSQYEMIRNNFYQYFAPLERH